MLFGSEVNLHPTRGNNFLDANVLDRSVGSQDATAVDRIIAMAEGGKFTLLLPYSVQDEIAHAKTPLAVKRQAARLMFSMKVDLTAAEQTTHQQIAAMLRGNADPGKHERDAFHLVESAKYGRHFITNDGRIIKHARAIWERLMLRALTPTQFIQDYYPETDGGAING